MRAFLQDTLTTLILAAVIFFGLKATVEHSVVVSPSMEPSIPVGQHLFINKIVYNFHEPERGDIALFHPPHNKQYDFIKRIIGLPGESVEIKEGIVYIHKEDGNVLPLDEPYITDPARYPFKGDILPENAYFVLGDNRNNSGDSRDGWTVPRQNIIGKAWLSIWPPAKWGLAANYPLQKQIDSSMNSK
ncbi:signal peptidase I [Chloroflexota bacterium]